MPPPTHNLRTRILVPSGVLGLGFDKTALANGIASKPDIICIDGGSTDSGPFSLGTGTSKYSRAACKSEWRQLMQARHELGVPLVIGSCGTCGTDSTVDWMLEMTTELAIELGQSVRVATLYSSQPAQRIVDALANDKLLPLSPAPELSHAGIHNCSNIVALGGAEQVNAALDAGADIVLAGRTSDAALIAALPLAHKRHAGAAWHAAKIAECGALCSTNPTSGVIVVDIDDHGFEVQAMADDAQCNPHSVSAHMLYENANPFQLHEPGGLLDVTDAVYTALDSGRVRVEGSAWVPAEHYTVKLEAARIGGYQTMMLATLRDAHYVQNAREWVASLGVFLDSEIQTRMSLDVSDYTIDIRLIGMDSVLGDLEPRQVCPVEVGVLCMITADSQAIADELAKLVNPFLLHYPLTRNEELPTFAFPYSPAQTSRGALYEFSMNHVLVLDDPMQAFKLTVVEVGNA